MELTDVLDQRFSVRDYKDEPVPDDLLEKVLEAGRIAPTGHNNQPQRIYVLRSPEALEKVRGLSRCAWNAPVVLMIALDEDAQWHNRLEAGVASGQQDVGIVTTYMMLRAQDLGLGTCWVNFFAPTEVARAFDLPAGQRVIALLTLGYPSDGARPGPMHEPRRPMGELVTYL